MPVLDAVVLDEHVNLTVEELCRTCRLDAADLVALVDAGIVDAIGTDRAVWRFPAPVLRRIHIAMRLQRDLEINYSGVALILDLLDELRSLREQMRRL